MTASEAGAPPQALRYDARPGWRHDPSTMSIDPHAKHVVPIAEGLVEITRGIAAARGALQGAGDPGLAVRGGEVTIDFELAMLEGGAVGMRVGGNPPGVTRERLYLETMQRVLARSNKVIVDANGASAPIILPPDVFRPRSQPQPQPAEPAQAPAAVVEAR